MQTEEGQNTCSAVNPTFLHCMELTGKNGKNEHEGYPGSNKTLDIYSVYSFVKWGVGLHDL